VDLAPLLFVEAKESVKFEGDGERRAWGTVAQPVTRTLRFLGNTPDLVLPFWVAVLALAVIGRIGFCQAALWLLSAHSKPPKGIKNRFLHRSLDKHLPAVAGQQFSPGCSLLTCQISSKM
jgi:hypothetical protein